MHQVMATTKLLISFITFLCCLPFSSSVQSSAILEAAEALFNSGYISMALTLQFGSSSIVPRSPSLTIFSASDTAFLQSGQPSLSLLHFHFSPHHFSLHTLQTLPFGTKIATFFPNHSLTVTSSASDGGEVAISGVRINESTIYDDGSSAVFGIEKFFDPNFEVSAMPGGGGDGHGGGGRSFEEASLVLKSKGYSFMASFLDLQLGEFRDQAMFTIFAPVDGVMKGLVKGDLSEYRSIFLKLIVPRKISWRDLVNLDNGVWLPTYLEGFMINVTRSSPQTLMLNGVQVIAPDLFSNSWLVVHGLRGSFVVQQRPPDTFNTWSGTGSYREKTTASFKVMKMLILIAFSFSQLF